MGSQQLLQLPHLSCHAGLAQKEMSRSKSAYKYLEHHNLKGDNHPMNLTNLLQRINTLHQTTFTLGERFPNGEQGAFVVRDPLGKRWVLKWSPGARNLQWAQGAQTVTDVLCDVGYPAPEYLLIGKIHEGIYSIQSVLPGAPMQRLLPAHVLRLFELNALQVGRAIPGGKDWHQEVIDTVLVGGDGYCLHAAMQHHSQRTADLLQTLQSVTLAHRAEPHRTTDIVHGDFQPANILVQEEQISGIVDWGGCLAGDCAFDIATLLFYAYDEIAVREQLWEYAQARASLNLLSLYFAHLILRQVDWSLRFHDQATSDRYITRGYMVLADIERRTPAGG
jgi:hypothetical protein